MALTQEFSCKKFVVHLIITPLMTISLYIRLPLDVSPCIYFLHSYYIGPKYVFHSFSMLDTCRTSSTCELVTLILENSQPSSLQNLFLLYLHPSWNSIIYKWALFSMSTMPLVTFLNVLSFFSVCFNWYMYYRPIFHFTNLIFLVLVFY